MIVVRAATMNDRDALIALLADAGMDYVDPPGAYTLAVDEEIIAGCGRMEDHGHIMMLRPLVTAKPYQGRGVGKLILNAIMPDDKPTALVARDEAVAFYRGMGFSHTDWNTVSATQQAECESCPNRAVCTPQPMIYIPAACIGFCDMKGELR